MLLWILGVYAISIPLYFLLEVGECDCGKEHSLSFCQVAARNWPNCRWLFTSAGHVLGIVQSPIFLVSMVLVVPIVVYQMITASRPEYCDPCFQLVPKHLLSPSQRVSFAEYKASLQKMQFRSLGLYKYRQRRLTEIVEYFVLGTRTTAAVYCINGEFQICVVDFFKDGMCVITNGMSRSQYQNLKHKSARTAFFNQQGVPFREPLKVVQSHRQRKKALSGVLSDQIRIRDNYWKQAFVYLERASCHSKSELGREYPPNCPPLEIGSLSGEQQVAAQS